MGTTPTAQEKTLIISALIAYKKSRIQLAQIIKDPDVSALYTRNVKEIDALINHFVDSPVRRSNATLS